MQANRYPDAATGRVASVKPFQIRGRFFTAVALHLSGPADAGFLAALDARLRQTPLFFENAPLVLDLEQAPQLGAELDWLMAELRARKLSVFGIQNATPAQEAAAAACGLIVLPPGRALPLERVTRPDTRSDNTRPGARATAAVAQPAPEPPPVATKLITQPVRSGQTVFADRGDLVVIGTVSSGAEIIATGNIHVYGRLRGRALAGVNGDSSARIFCNVLDAELLAIAGLYRTSENLGPDTPRSHVQVYLDGDRLQIESLN